MLQKIAHMWGLKDVSNVFIENAKITVSVAHCLILCCSSHATHSMVPSRDGLETSIIIFAIAFTRFAVMGVAHFTSGAHFGLPSPTSLVGPMINDLTLYRRQ